MKEFVEHTEKVRQLQKEYFRTRSQITLAESKSAERALDACIAKFKQYEQTPITAEWLESFGFKHQYEKNHLGEIDRYEWENAFQHFIVWHYKGRFECGMLGNVPIKTLADLYLAQSLCNIKIIEL